MGISEKPIKLSIADGRTVTDPIVIGESTDDDDHVWPVHAANDVVAWSDEVLKRAPRTGESGSLRTRRWPSTGA